MRMGGPVHDGLISRREICYSLRPPRKATPSNRRLAETAAARFRWTSRRIPYRRICPVFWPRDDEFNDERNRVAPRSTYRLLRSRTRNLF